MGVEKEKSGDLDGRSVDRYSLSLTLNQKIWFIFVVPTALCCVIYIADIATDIALVERHYSDSRYVAGTLTLALIYAPAIIFFAITLADDSKWPPLEEGPTRRLGFFLKQLILLIFFPIHAMHR